MPRKIDWIIHCCMNGGVCARCGKVEDGFIPYAVNAHTHGMERYGHKDFQLVLRLPVEEIGRILNTMGLRVQKGERFKDGELVFGIYEDCPVRLEEFTETDRTVLRVIIPDEHNRFPKESDCSERYRLQSLETEALYIGNGGCTCE